MEKSKFVSVVYLVHNESGVIENVIRDTVTVLTTLEIKWEILAVNDGSTDATAAILEKLTVENPNIRVVNHSSNKGYASAAKTGLKHAYGDIVFIIDSDGQHEPKDIPAFIDKINEGYDVVVGWRIKRCDYFIRVFLAGGLNVIFRALFGLKLHDLDCGFRVMRRDFINSLSIRDGSLIIGPQIFAHAKKIKAKVIELPVKHYPRKIGKTMWNPWKLPFMVVNIFFEVIGLKIDDMFNTKKENK